MLCFLAAFAEGIDLQAAGVAAAGIRLQYHPDSQVLSYFFSASTLGLFAGAIIGGRLSDRLGRKRVLVCSVLFFALLSVLTPSAWNTASLIGARLLTGLGLGGALPNLIAIGSESAPPQRRSAYVTMIYAGAPLGGALASLVSLLTTTTQWRWVFIVGGLVPLLVSPALMLWLPESLAFSRLRQQPAGEEGAPGTLLAFLQDGRLVRSLLLWASSFLALLMLYLLLNWLPTLLASGGLSKGAVAVAMIGFNLGGCLGALYVGTRMDTSVRRGAVLITYLTIPLALVLLAYGPRDARWVAILVCVLGTSVVAAQAILYACAPLFYPTRMRGTGVGFAVAVGRIGSIVGPMLGGVLVGAGRSAPQVLAGLLPVALIGGLCAITLVRKPPTAS